MAIRTVIRQTGAFLLGYAVWAILATALGLWWFPKQLTYLWAGMGVGLFYGLSLTTLGGRFAAPLQVAVSLFRMAVAAWVLVTLGQGHVPETGIVILGCFGYNLVLYPVGIVLTVHRFGKNGVSPGTGGKPPKAMGGVQS